APGYVPTGIRGERQGANGLHLTPALAAVPAFEEGCRFQAGQQEVVVAGMDGERGELEALKRARKLPPGPPIIVRTEQFPLDRGGIDSGRVGSPARKGPSTDRFEQARQPCGLIPTVETSVGSQEQFHECSPAMSDVRASSCLTDVSRERARSPS